ncbi:hypothetical protein JOB18_007657 [Solea senegalensis]|uniref:Uncharacterized protein n=1 Tax=Solea senegalensis TaxID=28829 RepID=A0AAV6R3Y7_SOLSE|nr:hypothetical protein JOB18_007657 [Solea senegalensis]
MDSSKSHREERERKGRAVMSNQKQKLAAGDLRQNRDDGSTQFDIRGKVWRLKPAVVNYECTIFSVGLETK